MLSSMLCSAALAATIKLHSVTLVQVRVDGTWVGRMVNDAVADVEPGPHTVEVCDVLGNVIGTLDLKVGDDVWLEFARGRLDVVPAPKLDDGVDYVADIPTITAQEFLELERSLAKRREKARMRVLLPAIERYWFEMRHVDSLLATFDTLDYRVEAALRLSQKTVDPFKFAAIEDHFPPGENRERAREAFGQ
jgi:hypothetical protein